MNIDPQATLSSIVLDHPACAAVLQARRIDFCCDGGRTVRDACAARGLDVAPVLAALEAAAGSRDAARAEDPRAMKTEELVAHIVSRHHAYLRSALPFLVPLASKVARVHGDHDPRLRDVQEVFFELREALDAHLDEEEQVLFRQVTAAAPDQAVLDRELSGMVEEHREIGAALRRIRELTDDFAPPSWACTSYRTLLAELQALEQDVLWHVHIENQVLRPRFAAA